MATTRSPKKPLKGKGRSSRARTSISNVPSEPEPALQPNPPEISLQSPDLAGGYPAAYYGGDRHTYRILSQILAEVRAARQHIQFVHTLLANTETGRKAGIKTPEEIKKAVLAKRAEIQKQREEEQAAYLRKRAQAGIKDNGLALTPEEELAFGRGEPLPPDPGVDD